MKILPFGAELSFLIKNGYKPSSPINIYIGFKSWQEGKENYIISPLATLVLPPWECPFEYFWPVKKCHVIVNDYGASQDYLDDVFFSLIEHEVSLICHTNLEQVTTIYK